MQLPHATPCPHQPCPGRESRRCSGLSAAHTVARTDPTCPCKPWATRGKSPARAGPEPGGPELGAGTGRRSASYELFYKCG